MKMEQEAGDVVETLQAHGYPAFFVGGYVRDKWLGRTIKDIDIATAAKPDQVMALFDHTIPTGLKHGTVTVIRGGYPFEVTTFRTEGSYGDFRRPDEVQFVSSLEEDLLRRDFTMNAMAMSKEGEWIDPYGGREDIRLKRLRAVGEPTERFKEDALRMMRCVRFAAEYGLEIEEATWQALLEQRHLMEHIALERIGAEWDRMLQGSNPYRAAKLLLQSGLMANLKEDFPIDADSWERAIRALAGDGTMSCDHMLMQCPSGDLRWYVFMLAWQCDATRAVSLFKLLRYSNDRQQWLRARMQFHQTILDHDVHVETWKLAVLRWGKPAAEDWLTVLRIVSQGWKAERGRSDPGHEVWAAWLAKKDLLHQGQVWLDEMPVYALKDLQVTGSAVIRVGAEYGLTQAGPWVGEVMQGLLEHVVLGNCQNREHDLLVCARALIEGRVGHDRDGQA